MKIAFQLSKARYGARRALRNITLALGLLLPGATFAETTIVALGDSLTAGYGLPEGDGLVPQLQNWLTTQGSDIKVINAGVSGDTTAGGLSRLDWSLTPETDALIVTLGGNDLLRGLPPSEVRDNLDAIVRTATERGLPVLLVPMEAPANMGADYKMQFDGVYREIATRYGAQITRPFFRMMVPQADTLDELRPLMQPDGIHPNKDGVERIVASLGPAILDLAASTAN